MSKNVLELPGLEHLISVCRSQSLRLRLEPPLDQALLPRGTLLGQAFDPILTATLSKFNGGWFHDWRVFSANHLEPLNEESRMNAEERLRQVVFYAGFDGLAYYLATVPSLADSNGIQPVMYLNMQEGVEMLPIASSVDKAFDLYARYLTALLDRYGSLEAVDEAAEEGDLDFFFPRNLPHLVARDSKLVQMLERKQFDSFTAWDRSSTDWIALVQREARRLT